MNLKSYYTFNYISILIISNSRQNPMGLQVALDEDLLANGSLFWDDGESLGMEMALIWIPNKKIAGLDRTYFCVQTGVNTWE